jgi:hypothetical protein
MSKQDEAGLILKLYELRRDPVMRTARDWYFMEFNPQSFQDYMATVFGEHGNHLRMVVSYWDMAAALVNTGAISLDMFNETNGEHWIVFSKLEPILPELRAQFGPQALKNLEKLVDDTPEGRERISIMRERMNALRAQAGALRNRPAEGATAATR